MSMNRSDHHPGRGSGSSPWARKTPVNVTAAAASQMTAPTARAQGVEPADSTMTHDGDDQPGEAHPEGPDRHPPMSEVLELRRLVHVRNCAPEATAVGREPSSSGGGHATAIRFGSFYGSRLNGGYSSVSSRKYADTRSCQR
jgi:hypothetical protein